MLVLTLSSRRIKRGIVNRARNLLQSIGDGTDQLFHAVTRDSRNGVEFQVALLAKIAQSFEARAIGRGVQLGGNNDHRFFDEGGAKGFKLAADNFERMDWIIGVGVACVDQVR